MKVASINQIIIEISDLGVFIKLFDGKKYRILPASTSMKSSLP